MDQASPNLTQSNVVPVVQTMPADLLKPLAVYLKLSANTSNSFLLESVDGGTSLARYSFVGADSMQLASGDSNTITVGAEVLDIGLFEYLRNRFSDLRAVEDRELPPFIGGAIGYLGFDCCGWFEPKLKQTSGQSHGA